jgi:hypothetical protein
MNVREWCAEVDEEIILADGFDDAFVGYAERCGMGPVAVYDREKCIEVLVKDLLFGSHEEAEEYFDFNVVGSYVGERTPMFITRKTE